MHLADLLSLLGEHSTFQRSPKKQVQDLNKNEKKSEGVRTRQGQRERGEKKKTNLDASSPNRFPAGLLVLLPVGSLMSCRKTKEVSRLRAVSKKAKWDEPTEQ